MTMRRLVARIRGMNGETKLAIGVVTAALALVFAPAWVVASILGAVTVLWGVAACLVALSTDDQA